MTIAESYRFVIFFLVFAMEVISKLTYQRHFGMLDEIPANDIPWSEKKNAAVFRGALT